MQWIINAILRYKNFLLYLFLLFIGLVFSGTHSGIHKSRLAKSSLFISGIIHQPFTRLADYTNLVEQNQQLLRENNALKSLVLEKFERGKETSIEEQNLKSPQFWSLPAKVIRNSYTKNKNILLIDQGSEDFIQADMGVIGPQGVVGIVNRTSQGYATVLSILNEEIKINSKFKNSNVFGSLSWSGKTPNHMWLDDISVINPVKVGDTIVTGGMSAYFPEGIVVGTVAEVEQPETGGYYKIGVQLVNNMTDLDYVYVIGNKDREEIIQLIDPTP